MKFKKLIIGVVAIAAVGAMTSTVRAAEKYSSMNIYGAYKEMEATAYCDHGLCFDETVPKAGITVAAAKEYIGKTFIIYREDWELIGIYECHDTGGDYRIKNGSVVDIYMDDEAECWKFGRQKVHVQIVDAKG